jgi:hypothetical protein
MEWDCGLFSFRLDYLLFPRYFSIGYDPSSEGYAFAGIASPSLWYEFFSDLVQSADALFSHVSDWTGCW